MERLENTSVTAKGEYSINFSRVERKFSLSLHYNRSNSFLIRKIHQFKAKDSEIAIFMILVLILIYLMLVILSISINIL